MLPENINDNENIANDDEFLGDFRSRMNPDSIEEVIEEKQSVKKAKNKGRIIGTCVGVIIAAVLGWEFVSPRVGEPMNTEIPIIRRSTAPIKVRPSDPGGMDVPNRDKQVYSRIGDIEDEPVVEHLLPTPEQPVEPPKSELASAQEEAPMPIAKPIDSKGRVIEAKKAEEILGIPSVKEEVEKKVEVKEVLPTPKPLPVVKEMPAKQEIPIAKQKPVVPQKVMEAVKKEAPVKVKVEAVKNVEKNSSNDVMKKGVWQIQLVSVKGEKAAQNAYKMAMRKHGQILKNVPYEIAKADLGIKGVYYRLKVGAFKNRNGADELCKRLKQFGQSCFVTQKK
jgi:cell division septation protein DedD